ncbi:MAG: ATP-binding cassette domain-containing protein [Rhodospirillaceae bacterium]|nr:ATP-binding cassette domain-containing protein [Rhodospirillaceae bacterium]MCK5545814.1 ATP-binding cassette domain-containing protein [Rhodospirillaceae bacterium]
MFDIQDASVQYNGHAVLNGVSLSIRQGEHVALVGQSGAGKTTLLNLLYEQHKKEIALLPQDLGLVQTLSVFHNIYIARLNRHPAWYNVLNLAHPMQREVAPIREIARRLRLEDKLFTPVGELSGGQRQRTAVGRAIHQGSSILLGDEPVSAVDEKQARVILDCIYEGYETVVMALHDVTLALAYSDRIIGIKDGRIVLDQPSSGMEPSDLDDLYHH